MPSARAAVAGGATWLGTALLDEALALRAAGITGPRVLAWLIGPGRALGATRSRADVDLSVNAALGAGRGGRGGRAQTGTTARVHLKVDTGLCRGGAALADWAGPGRRRSQGRGRRASVRVVGLWSHFAYADAPGHPTIDAPGRGRSGEAVALAEGAGHATPRSATWPTRPPP